MAQIFLLVIGCVICLEAVAQTGPKEPRIVFVAMPTPLPKPNYKVTVRVPLDLSIGADGRVTDVQLRSSSGDARFDEKVRKYYSLFRFVPALDDNGTPIPSTYKFVYKYSVDEKVTLPSTPPADVPGGETVGEPGVSNSRVFDEVDRIKRMRCRDFLWEYEFMKDIAGARPVYNERMLRTSLAMFVVHKSVRGDELNTLNNAFSAGVREAVNECRKRPEASYFLDVLSPALESHLKR